LAAQRTARAVQTALTKTPSSNRCTK